MTALIKRLAPVARTVAWAPLLAGALASVAIVEAAGSSPLGRWPGMSVLALYIGAAFLLDDAASATTAATPQSLARRRMLRIGLALPLLASVWIGVLWYATAADDSWSGTDARAALSLQFAAILALTLAASATALRIMPDERGGWMGAVVPLSLFGVALWLPESWTLLAAPHDDAWHATQQRWAALLACGLLTLMWANRDPAARNGRCLQRNATRARLPEQPDHAETHEASG